MLHSASRFLKAAALPTVAVVSTLMTPVSGMVQAEPANASKSCSAAALSANLMCTFALLAGSVQGITASEFKATVTDSADDTFVEIYSQTCRACSALAPRLNSLALLLPKLPVSPAGIESKIVKMDIDDKEGLPEPVYGVRQLHLVVDS